MATQTRRKKLLALGMAVPLVLSLAACESANTLRVNSDGTATMVSDFIDDDGFMKMAGVSDCDDLMSDVDSATTDVDVTVEDISSGDNFACRMTMNSAGTAIDEQTLEETDDTFILHLGDEGLEGFSADDLEAMEALGGTMKFSLTVEMPGEIVNATAGKVKGNKVVFEDLKDLQQAVTIEGKKDASTASAVAAATEGISPVVWVIIAVVAVLAIGGVVFAVTRSKNKKNQVSYGQPMPGGAPMPGGQPMAGSQPMPGTQPMAGAQMGAPAQQPWQQQPAPQQPAPWQQAEQPQAGQPYSPQQPGTDPAAGQVGPDQPDQA